MIRALFVAMTFLSVSAAAQTGPCSAGLQDPPTFALVTSSPVRLTFRHTVHAILSEPTVTIAGNEISVVQMVYETAVYPPASCNSQSVSLGDLTPGPYKLTWKYQSVSNVTLETFSFPFTLPEPSPCVAGIVIQPQSPVAGQPFSIVYSATFRGFLQTPDVAIDNGITIDQSAVIADPAFSGHVPCARGIIQIGGLQPGYYPITVRSNSGAAMSEAVSVRPLARTRAVRSH